MNALPYGTPVRVNKPGHELHGATGWIGGNNSLERYMAEGEPYVPPFTYIVDIPTYDNEDVNHWGFLPSEVEVIG